MSSMVVTELTSQSPIGLLKAPANYIAARDGRPCGMSSDVGARGWGTFGDDMATQEQQHAGWRNTYPEHATHVRHRAHVPITDGLIEDRGNLQRSEGRAAVWREQRSSSEGTADVDDDMATLEQQHAGWRNTYREHARHGRHRAHVPIADGLIEGVGKLQRSKRRAAVWSEWRPRSEGIGDDDTAMQ
jgi:hypothetical protein